MLTIDALKAKTHIPVIIVDHRGIVVHINQIFEKTWGWKKDVLIGKTLTTIIPDTLKDAHHMGFSRFLLTGKPTILNQAIKLPILPADGKETIAEHFITAEKISGNWVFGASIKPLEETEKKV
jgi:PAS domain S-box-containing protein